MVKSSAVPSRELKSIALSADLCIGGGGIAGVCAAITAARQGLQVVLLQDRPVLGGNASSEVRLWILGATSHMGNNNRWAREGGVMDEILVENLHRNPEGNPVLVDALLLEMVTREPNITLLLNTAIHQVDSGDGPRVRALRAFCSQNSTEYVVSAPLFCDATGDGVIGFLAGAAFRMGAEGRAEFDEGMAPSAEYGELLGHSLYFYSRDTGRPVKFTPPSFALTDITKLPRYRKFNTKDHGCKLWWLEYGGRLDTVHDTETIKWELWKVVYGIWNYIKNSGQFPDAENLTLDWVGMIPGKRESRRFEGDYMISQRDLVEQRRHPDFVSFGGWAIDLHPADGVFSEKPGCNQYHSKGVFGIPYRCFYSRNVENLFLAGRVISASHVAFGSTRVMATCGHNAQVIGAAAALCKEQGLLPRDLAAPGRIGQLQARLASLGQYIPHFALHDRHDLASAATLTASSEFQLRHWPADGPDQTLDFPIAQMLPLKAGPVPTVTLTVRALRATTLRAACRIAAKPENHTPEITLAEQSIPLEPGEQVIALRFAATLPQDQYAFVTLEANPDLVVRTTRQLVTGVLSVHHRYNPAVATSANQDAPAGGGIDAFGFWCPQRRPGGQNFALTLDQPLARFAAAQVVNGVDRPVNQPNAWVADPTDSAPRLTLRWASAQTLRRLVLTFDTDLDHPMESVLMGHPEADMPYCVRQYRVLDGSGRELVSVNDNHLTRREHTLPADLSTDTLVIETRHPSPHVPAALFAVRVYSS